ncbi:hypothetical protein HD_0047 [[Haemophilus] ducreyi 35000HP]|uniref:Uncharacterized protein n=1 Tax=Haemophilus ducreyi (strain 35000HP / ATCC 700724) TaxID=233412 RepID=Q7VPL7_HAEDU|nr:hypothetical protein HD_0047 [[Haemophilus] ducreyi 35000HP]
MVFLWQSQKQAGELGRNQLNFAILRTFLLH